MKYSYIQQLLIAIDQLLNAIIFGWADETISARAHRCNKMRRWYIAEKVIDTLFFWQDEHCKKSHESEKARAKIQKGKR